MSSRLRAIAVASCTAVIVSGAVLAGAVGTAAAGTTPAFSANPTHGPVGSTVKLFDRGHHFTPTDTVTINGLTATDTYISAYKLRVVVPAAATTGPVVVTDTATSQTMTGPTFTVQRPTTAAVSQSARTLNYPATLTVTGTLSAGSTRVSGQPAILQRRNPGATSWYRVSGTPKAQTNQHGQVHWRVTPRANGAYRVQFLASPAFAGSHSPGVHIKVIPRLRLDSIRTLPARTASLITGTIQPALTGAVHLQRYYGGAWHGAGTVNARHGKFAFTVSPTSLGKLAFRVTRSGDGLHLKTTSGTLRVLVVNRTLVLGDSGPDVLQVQKRLRKLHYDIGPVNGTFGDDTLHAVTAFEKVQGFTRDGQVSTRVWKALNDPKRIHLRHPIPSAALAVEVNIPKQVLILAKYGRVWRILDTSTAGGYLYTNSQGQTERAITPTGHFSIQYKLTGTVVSKLGTLYYPSYFTTTGYAIHGEGNGNDGGEVPPYPNSHGCVRITDNAVLRYYSMLTVGTSVWVY
jgi:peptidoglycan hydrolase-like protein with peptidoglycan-binding domain